MTQPKLLLDTSACSRIATSPNRSSIEAHLDSRFRRVVSVHTFYELLQQIEGGDGSHFNADREVIKVAAGTTRPPFMLPSPISHAVESVLRLPRPTAPVPPQRLKQTYDLVMKARTRDQLFQGVPVIRGLRQIRQLDPHLIREEHALGEQWHVERLKWLKRSRVAPLSPEEWVRLVVKQVGLSLDNGQAVELSKRLDAAYQFDLEIWKLATAPNSNYNPEKHSNDWSDFQQTMYLCDPAIHLMTADRPLCNKVKSSHQANRVLFLPDYLNLNGLSL